MNRREQNNEPLSPETRVPVRTTRQKLLAAVFIAAVLLGGWLISSTLLHSKPELNRRKPAKMKTVVQIQILQPANHAVAIEAMGTVIAARRLELTPRVAGRVTMVSEKLVPGSLLAKDDLVLTLDEQDYLLALQRSQNNLRKAAMDLRLEQGNQAVAKQEFELIREYADSGLSNAPLDLALRKPQLAKAQAAEAVARTDMDQAELNLKRTVLQAPFNAVVLDKKVTIGAEVSPQTTVATLAGTDEFWVQVTLPRHDLSDLLLPTGDSQPIPVSLYPASGNTNSKLLHWQGTILRLLPDVDPRGLMARLLISIKNPLLQDHRNPLLLGSMVKAMLPGQTIAACFAVPRTSVRSDQTVLLADSDNTLQIRPVTVARMDREQAFITEGLKEGERLIISQISAPIVGMELTAADRPKSERPQSAP